MSHYPKIDSAAPAAGPLQRCLMSEPKSPFARVANPEGH